jgi:hypothetical protein
MAAEDIFGPDVGFLKGRTVRRNPPRISTDDTYSPLPPSVHERYKDVTLCADIMYVNGIPFFISIEMSVLNMTVSGLALLLSLSPPSN